MIGSNLWSTLDSLGFQVARTLLEIIWQSSILFAAAAMLWLWLRGRSARVRHVLLVTTLLLVPILPVLTSAASRLGTPRAEVRILPAYSAPVVQAIQPVTESFHPAPAGAMETPIQPAPPPFSPLDYPWALVCIAYFGGLAGFLTWILIGRVRIVRWVRNATPCLDERILSAFRSAREEFRLTRDFLILESPQVRAAITTGILHPVVLLPQGFADSLSDHDLRAVATHETAHIKRRDPLSLLLVSLVRAVLFFHALVWMACRQVSHLAEQACDDAVLGATGESLPYAKLLARFAETLPRRALSTEVAAGIMLSKGAFLRRVEAILSDRDRIRRLTKLALTGTLLAAVLSLTIALAVPLGEKDQLEVQEATKPAGTILAKGQVVDEAGNPVPDALVYACRPSEEKGGYFIESETRTNVEGRFDFPSLPVADRNEWIYMLYAWKAGYAWRSCHLTYRPGYPRRMATGKSDISFALSLAASFGGRVLDNGGRPISGARVIPLFDRDKGNLGIETILVAWPGLEFITATTDRNGRFAFDSAPADSRCRFTVEAEGYGTLYANSFASENAELKPFPVPGEDVEIRLGLASRIIGILASEKDGKPIPGMTIYARDKGDRGLARARTDDQGEFVLKGIPAGTYMVWVGPGRVGGLLVRPVEVKLAEGETREGVQLTLSEGVNVEGRVLDSATRKPIKDASVQMLSFSGFPILVAGSTKTGGAGAFRFRVLPGKYKIGALADGYHTASPLDIVVGDQPTMRIKEILLGPSGEK